MGNSGAKEREEKLQQARPLTIYDACVQGRRWNQEDRHVMLPALPDLPEVAFFGVFDGHNGDAAAQYCADNMAKEVGRQISKAGKLTSKCISRSFLAVDDAFLGMSDGTPNDAGCTAVVVAFDRLAQRLVSANAGDARAVLSRAGFAHALTVDHKPSSETEQERIMKAGRTVIDGRLDGTLAVSRAIGDLSFKRNKSSRSSKPEDLALTPLPDCYELALEDNDEFFVLACDGLFDVMTNQEVVDFIRSRLPIMFLRAPPPELLHAKPVGDNAEVSGAASEAADEAAERPDAGGAGRGRAEVKDDFPADGEALARARKTMRNRRNIQDMAHELANHAVERGSTDNVTVVIVLLGPAPAPATAAIPEAAEEEASHDALDLFRRTLKGE